MEDLEARPDTPMSVEYRIMEKGKEKGITTTAIEALPESLQKMKKEDEEDKRLGKDKRLIDLVRRLSCFRAENRFFRQVRKAAVASHETNFITALALRNSSDRLQCSLSGVYRALFVIVEDLGRLYGGSIEDGLQTAFQRFATDIDRCRYDLSDIREHSQSILQSTVDFIERTDLLQAEWEDCLENKF